MPLHATVQIQRPMPPDTYPAITTDQGRVSPVATAIAGAVVGGLAAGGYVASKKLPSEPPDIPPASPIPMKPKEGV
jgi:hypothetical protein